MNCGEILAHAQQLAPLQTLKDWGEIERERNREKQRERERGTGRLGRKRERERADGFVVMKHNLKKGHKIAWS